MTEENSSSKSLPGLTVSKAEAITKIKSRIYEGQNLRERIDTTRKTRQILRLSKSREETSICGDDEWQECLSDYYTWSRLNVELLSRMFDNSSAADSYRLHYRLATEKKDSLPIIDSIITLRGVLDSEIHELEFISGRVELGFIDEVGGQPTPSLQANRGTPMNNNIFIVHGRDEAPKESVARFIDKLGLHAIVLHEQPNAGRTIIEKFEDYSNVGFAIVLLTPDDIGAPHDKKDQTQPRARQNVILELGYFMGKLGRGKVCALYKEGVEIPSDYQGVLYIPMDSAGAWRMALAKEIKNAGIEIDLNKL